MPIDPSRLAAMSMFGDVAAGPSPAALAAQDQAYAQAMGDFRAWKAPPPRYGQALAPYQGGMMPRGGGAMAPYAGGGMPAVQGGVPAAYAPGGGMMPAGGGSPPYGRPMGLPSGPGSPLGLPRGSVINALGTPVPGVGGAGAGLPPTSPPGAGPGPGPGPGGFAGRGAGWRASGLPGVLGKTGTAGTLARTGAGIGLSIGGNYLGKALGGSDTAAGRFASGAGTGAGLGMMLGPYGAAAGGAVGGLLGMVMGKPKKGVEPITNLSTAMSTAGFDPGQSQQLMTYYNVLAQLGGNTKESKQRAYESVVPMFESMLMQQLGLGAGGAGGQGTLPTPADYAALQASTAKFIAPYHQASLVNAQTQADYLRSNGDSLPPAYRSVMQAGAMSGQIASVNLANAYAAQSQLAPQAAAIQTGIQQQQSVASQLQQQALSQAMSGGSAGGAAELEALLGGK